MKSINITPLMARIMDALYDDQQKTRLPNLANAITEARRGVAVTGSQLASPMGQLRKLKWVQREKRTVGEKIVGPQTFPIIERFYWITPLGISVWEAMGSHVDPVAGGTIMLDELDKPNGLYLTLEYDKLPEHEHTWIEHYAVDTAEPWRPNLRICTSCGASEDLQPLLPPTHAEHDERSFKPSDDKFLGRHTIYTDGDPYMTRIWFGRLRLHIFHRGDGDDSPHDHPWDFKTYPLTPYVEEVFYSVGPDSDGILRSVFRVVPAWRPSWRKAEFRHKVVGRYAGYVEKNGSQIEVDAEGANALAFTGWKPATDSRKIVTVVWRGKERRAWGFWIKDARRWCWQAWEDVKKFGFKHNCD